MNRFFSIFMVVASSCTFTFAQSTNFTGTSTETIGFTNLTFYGEAGGNAAEINRVALFNSVDTSYTGGDGEDEVNTGEGGNGLKLASPGIATIGVEANSKTVIRGGNGGNVTALPVTAFLSGGSGINFFHFAPLPGQGMILNHAEVYGGNGGSATGMDGDTVEAGGGDGIFIFNRGFLELTQTTIYGGNGGYVTTSNGVESTSSKATGGNGVKKPKNAVIAPLGDGISLFGGNGGHYESWSGSNTTYTYVNTSGGDGMLAFAGSTSNLVISGGEYTGGKGGTSILSPLENETPTDGESLAHGGHGISYEGTGSSSAIKAIISGGTFVGAAGGTAENTVANANTHANGGNGLLLINSVAEISGGKFMGGMAGTANGIEGTVGVGLELNNSSVDIFGGTFDNVRLTGDGTSDLTFTNGTIEGRLLLAGTDITTYDLSLVGSDSVISSGIYLVDGTANVDQWSDHHFRDTTVYDGTMNFNGQGFNLEAGSSFALMDKEAAVKFNGGFTAKSNSTITTVFDGVGSSIIEGTNLTFEAGAQWKIDGRGANAVANGQKIAMASDGGTLASDLDLSDVEFLGGSWAGAIVDFDPSTTTEIIGTYRIRSLEIALGLEAGSDFYEAMVQLSDYTSITNSADDAYVPLKTLSAEMAATTLADGYTHAPEMASALIRAQGLFSDQITDRSRSYRRYKRVAESSSAPKGPGGWSDSLPRKYEIPETYQVWGRGYGSFFKQGEADGFGGYDTYIGGGVMGLDKRFSNLLLGLGGGYAHTTISGNWGSDGQADTGYGTAYAAINGEKGFLDININYAFNDVETEGSPVMGYEGEYDASTMGLYIGGGMDFSTFNDSMLFTPEVSLLSTYYDRDGYTETAAAAGPYPDKVWDAYDQWSYLSSLGATLSMNRQFESFDLEMEFHPEIRAHWLHEFNADMDADTYLMEGGTTPIGVALQAREEDLIKVGAGVRFAKWNSDTLEFGLDFDGIFGEDYEAYIFSGKLLHRF